MKDKAFVIVAGICIGLVFVIVGGMIGFTIWNVQQKAHMTCLVSSKEAVRSGDSNQYRVYTKDCGVLSVEDSLWATRWDSADVYNEIELDQEYEFYTQGIRLPFLSMFPNILTAEAVA